MSHGSNPTRHHYLIDTKLIAYRLHQTGRGIGGILDAISSMLINHPKGDVYLFFDKGKSSYRLEISPTYKGHRASANAKQSVEQQAIMKAFQEDYIKLIDIVKHLPVKVLAVQDVEADDLVSIVATKLQDDINNKIYLVTSDKDYLNLVVENDNTVMLDFFTGGKTVTRKDVVEQFSLNTRRQFLVKKSILGDKGDNILFIKGVADVKAKFIFDSIYTKYKDPTDNFIIQMIEKFMTDNPKLPIHKNHQDVGRTTAKDAFEANMKLAETFTDTSNLTPAQCIEWGKCLVHKGIGLTHDEMFNVGLDILGYPVSISTDTAKVFQIKDM